MLKKTTVLFAVILAVTILCLSACSGGWREDYEGFLDDLMGKVDVERELENIDAEEVIREKLEEYSEGQTIWFQFGDFDGDGTSEAFAFSGKAAAEYLEGALWYVNENYAAELGANGKWQNPEIVTVEGTNFLIAENLEDGLTCCRQSNCLITHVRDNQIALIILQSHSKVTIEVCYSGVQDTVVLVNLLYISTDNNVNLVGNGT